MQPPPNSPRVLVVEDDAGIAMGLRINLEKEGYTVQVETDGEAGLQAVRSLSPDLLILDVMLPKMNGFEVLQALRRDGYTKPVMVLSARTGEMDKVTGLELGAIDYIAKPFGLAEMLARVRAALRRGNAMGRSFAWADVVVDVDARKVRKAGLVVDITATEFDVLMCLLESRGRALTREDIFHKVWGPKHHGTPRTIDNFIQQLRAKLEQSPQEPKHFHTVRGVGYRFEP